MYLIHINNNYYIKERWFRGETSNYILMKALKYQHFQSYVHRIVHKKTGNLLNI